MRIGLSNQINSFNKRWIAYLEEHQIPYKLVDCYSNNILKELEGCEAFLWHFHQGNPKDVLFAKQLLYSLQLVGKITFPDFNTIWHFDDKIGQKYLLEAIGAPVPETKIFYTKNEALAWAENAEFPKVFKLSKGASSQNVKLIKSKSEAFKIINKAFYRGFPIYEPLSNFLERLRKYRNKMTDFRDIIEGFGRFVIPPIYSKINGRERGYVYFQDFIKSNDSDIRVVVIDNKAFAIKRMVRDNDFRASGSGRLHYDPNLIPEGSVRLSLALADILKGQSIAFDYVYDNGDPKVLEVSYGFIPEGYDRCPGFWDKDLIWHEGSFNPYGWILEAIVRKITFSV